MPPPVNLPTRRRLTWRILLDMPIHLTAPRATPDGLVRSVIFEQDEPRDDTKPGWFVLLSVSNSGWLPIHCNDFVVPLCFTFPGRQVLGAWLSSDTAARPAAKPTIRILEGPEYQRPESGEADRVQVAGHFRLRAAEVYSITVILSGTPASGSQTPVHLDGELPRGEVTACPRP